MSKNIAEQIAAAEQKRAALAARCKAIMDEAAEEGSTLNAGQQEEFDENEADMLAVDKHLVNLRKIEKMGKATASPVEGGTAQQASQSRTSVPVRVKKRENLGNGIGFARFCRVKALSQMDIEPMTTVAARHYGEDSLIYGLAKAAVEPGTVESGNWASALVGEETNVFADFNAFLRPMTIVGRFGAGGVPALRGVPFRVPLIGQTNGGEAYWVGESQPKPLTKFGFARTTLEPNKLASITVLSMELIRDSSPNAELIMRDELAAAMVSRWDKTFVDPTNSGITGVKPAAISNGAPTVASVTYSDADDVRLDIRSLYQKFINALNTPSNGVWIMSHGNALALSMITNALGQREFPGITMNGGTLEGLPVIASEHVGNIVILVNASDIYIGDEGGIEIDLSREASLEMLDSGFDQNAPTGAEMVSLWQNNLVGLKAERTVNWKRNPYRQGVAVLTGVEWGGAINVS
jgi:hypothetical protein